MGWVQVTANSHRENHNHNHNHSNNSRIILNGFQEAKHQTHQEHGNKVQVLR